MGTRAPVKGMDFALVHGLVIYSGSLALSDSVSPFSHSEQTLTFCDLLPKQEAASWAELSIWKVLSASPYLVFWQTPPCASAQGLVFFLL